MNFFRSCLKALRGATAVCVAVVILPMQANAALLSAIDDAALVNLYNATGGASWTNNTGWSGSLGVMTDGTGPGETAPFGVTFQGGTVLEIILSNNNLIGSPWSGATPLDLQWMPLLSTFVLSNNSLTGELPDPGLLPYTLDTLTLSVNQLTTPAAGFPNYSFTVLTSLDLSNNQLSGDLPDATLLPAPGPVTSGLLSLRLGGNQFTTPVTGFPDYSSLTALKTLNLSNNQLTGDLPAASRFPSTLVTLNLGGLAAGNQFTTPATGFPDYSSLSALNYLDLNNNQLTGDLPAAALFPISLATLSLAGDATTVTNQLTTPLTGFPDYGATLTALTTLHLAYNQILGPEPALYTTWHAVTGHSGQITTVPSIVSPGSGAFLPLGAVTVWGNSAEPNAQMTVALQDATDTNVRTAFITADAAGIWSANLSLAGLAEGDYALRARTNHQWSGHLFSIFANYTHPGNTVTIDLTPPVIDTPLADVIAEATGVNTSVSLNTPTATDTSPFVVFSNDAPATYPLGTTTVTWTATDVPGNTSTATQNVTVSDTTAPVINGGVALADVTAEATGTRTTITLTTPTATDVFAVTITNDAPASGYSLGTTVVTWTATDANGNSSTATQNVTIADTTAPVMNGTPLADVVAEATGSNTLVILTAPTATDLFAVTVTGDLPVGGFYPLGTTVVTWSATDSSGNKSTATQNVIVSDTTVPVINGGSPLADVIVEATGTLTAVTLTEPTATDATTVTFTNNAPAGGFPLGTTTVFWTAADAGGNTSLALQDVIVADTTAPVINGGSPLADVTAEATGAQTAVTLIEPTATDLFAVTITNDAPAGGYPVGTTVVTWTATDANGQQATVAQNVIISDTTAPVINGTPLADVVVEATGVLTPVTLTAPTATDLFAVTVTNNVPPVGGFPLGTTVVTWTATDANGQQATTTQNVIVSDTTAPLITLNGLSPVTVEAGTPYTDARATVTDAVDGINNSLAGVSTVNTAVPGNYTVTYNYTDAAGNAAVQVIRTVNVVDTTPPVILLNGVSPVTVEAGTTYIDALATVQDNVDATDNALVGASTVNIFVPGTYAVAYNYTDAAGNAAAQVVRVVHVVDTTAPVIVLNGSSPVSVLVGTTYTDALATVTDNVDATDNALAGVSTVNTAVPGNYTVTYNYTDAAGNAAAQVVREVNVHVPDTTAPVITLLGDNPMTVTQGGTFTDPGATVSDNVDTGLTATVTGTVDTSTVGSYTLTYNATDNAGNTAVAVTRTVNVSAAASGGGGGGGFGLGFLLMLLPLFVFAGRKRRFV